MGKASITIAIGALWNGQEQLNKVNNDISRIALLTAKSSASTTRDLAIQGESWVELGNKIYDAGTKMESVGNTLITAITVPMTKVGGYCVDQAVNFDTAIANLRKTSDLTADQLEAMGQAALDASTKQPVDAATIVNIEALGAQLGIADDNLESFARTVSGLDIATNMDADTAATEMARFANITGMSESEFSNYGSTIVAIGNNMATTESETSALAQRFASAGVAAGMSQADILGMSGALSSLGVKAEMGGSALSKTINAIGVAVSRGGDDLEAFADRADMSADEFAAAWRDDAAGTFNDLVESMGKSVAAGEDVNAMLSDLGITNIRQSDVMRRLVDSTEAVTGKQSVLASALDLSRGAWEENTALQTEVDKRNESMQSRLDVLKNKVEAVAITVGTPLTDALIDALDALQPLFQGVADAAQAFADMDEEDQRTILSLAGVVTAAGPVLSVAGKLVQGIGNVNSAFGKAQEKVAIYGDALDTVDGSQMLHYASSKELSAQLGTVQNAAAKAAGGAENYVKAWKGMTSSAKVVRDSAEKINDLAGKVNSLGEGSDKTRKSLLKQVSALEKQRDAAQGSYEKSAALVTTWSKSSSEAEKAADGIDGLSGSLEKVKAGTVDVSKELTAASGVASSATSTFGTNLANGFKLAASSAVAMAKNFALGALQAGVISLAITGVTAVVGLLISSYEEQKERTENLEKATDGLTDATNKSIKAAKDQEVAYQDNKISLTEAREAVDDAIESQAKLADTISQGNAEASAQMGQLQAAYSVIKEYANQTGLGADEQGRLKAAVDTFNGICGTSVEVLDAENGKLGENGEAIDNVTTKLGGYVQQKLEQIRLEAYQEHLKNLYEQQAEDIQALATAQKAYNDEMDALGTKEDYVSRYVESYKNLHTNVKMTDEQLQQMAEDIYDSAAAGAYANSGIEDATKSLETINGSISNTEAAIGSASAATDGFANSVENFAQFDASINNACTGAGKDLQQFSKDLADTGLSVDQLKQVNDEDWIKIVAAYDGNSSSIVDTLNQLQYDMGDSGDRAVNALSDALLSGREGIGDAASQLVQEAASGDWSGLVADMRDHGFDIPEELATALESNSGAPSEASDRMLSLVAVKLSGGDLEQAANILGGDVDAGLAEGIANGTLSEEEAALLGEDVMNATKTELDSHSPSKVFEGIGGDVDAGLANGIDGSSDGPATSATNLGKAVIDGISGLVGDMTGVGSNSGSGLNSGLLSWLNPVKSSGSSLKQGAESGVNGTAKDLSTEGSSAGKLFSSGIAAFVGSVSSAGYGLYSAVTGETSGTVRALGGYGSDASGKFASGIGANARSVLAQANIIASNAMKASAYGNSYSWGLDLGSNFASGIRAARGWVSSAALAIANAASNILHFSVPDAGPWSGSERGGVTSGMHLAQNIASGMTRGIPEVRRAALAVAAATSVPVPSLGARAVGGYQSKYGDSGRNMTTNNWSLTINGAHPRDASPRAQELIGELFGEFGMVADMGV